MVFQGFGGIAVHLLRAPALVDHGGKLNSSRAFTKCSPSPYMVQMTTDFCSVFMEGTGSMALGGTGEMSFESPLRAFLISFTHWKSAAL